MLYENMKELTLPNLPLWRELRSFSFISGQHVPPLSLHLASRQRAEAAPHPLGPAEDPEALMSVPEAGDAAGTTPAIAVKELRACQDG